MSPAAKAVASKDIRPCKPPEKAMPMPQHLDLAAMRGRHGMVLGTLAVWRNRVHARRELQRLALRAPDNVLADARTSRYAAECEARRWFWQEFLDRQWP